MGSWNDDVVPADRSYVKAWAREVTQSLGGDLNGARSKSERASQVEKPDLGQIERGLGLLRKALPK